MIDSISAVLPRSLLGATPGLGAFGVETPGIIPNVVPATAQAPAQDFGDMLGAAIDGVNAKMQTAEVEKARVMSGETNNLHQAVLAMQEAGVAFSLMTEVRNKLVESYQEIMRMQV